MDAADSPTLPAHRWRSTCSGAARGVELDRGRIDYFERGEGPVLVFAHGWLANANLWREVVDSLSSRFRCIVLDLPLGSHRQPMEPPPTSRRGGCGRADHRGS